MQICRHVILGICCILAVIHSDDTDTPFPYFTSSTYQYSVKVIPIFWPFYIKVAEQYERKPFFQS
jgi:hypothetical protein